MTPIRYRLHLTPDAAAGTFTGELTLELMLDAEARDITLDCLGLDIEAAWLGAVPIAWRLEEGRLILTPAAPMDGQASLRIRHAGRLSDTPRGLYRGEGFVASQLQPDHAKRVFPCLDDPGRRAVFELSIAVPDGQTAVSNAAVVSHQAGVVTFARTPPLPTHLMAVAVGPFHRTVQGAVALNSLAPGPNDGWAVDIAGAALRFCNDRLGQTAPFEKLDLVLLPQVGAAGMENTGAIVLRQAALAQPTREAATLIAHEVAHQWFGGLVTPAGWEDLWLNEGFATWLAPRALAAIAPHLADDAAETRAIREALHADWAPTGRPLRQGGATSGEIAELFDVIAYRKGAGLLGMLEAWLGEETFRQGLTLYLQRHALGVACAADLWSALEAASGRPVAAVAGPFAEQPGAPAVRLGWRDETLTITRADQGVGPLPLRLKAGLADGRTVEADCLLDGAADVALPGAIAWAFANRGATGYLRAQPTPVRPPLGELSDAEATVLLEDSWLSLWIGETDLLAHLGLIREAGAAGLGLGSARNHLREIGDLLAGGARQAAFDRWRATLAGLTEPTGAAFDDLHGQLATTPDRDRLIADLCAVRESSARPRQLALLADPGLSEAEAQLACESLLANTAAAADTWSWLKANWDEAGTRLVGWGGRGAVAGLAAFSDTVVARDIAAFFAERTPAGAERTLGASLGRIAGRAHFRRQWQVPMDCLLMQTMAGGPPATPRQTAGRRLLGLLAAGFDGALLQRRLLDQQGQAAPPWMHTPQNLQAALAAIERQTIQSWSSGAIDPGDLSQRLIEDLTAAADQLDQLARRLPEGDGAIYAQAAAGLVRHRTSRDRGVHEAILLAELSGDARLADQLRAEALASPAAPGFDPFLKAPNRRQRLDLKALLAGAPGALRALADEIGAARAV